jgi:hypothetical protein
MPWALQNAMVVSSWLPMCIEHWLTAGLTLAVGRISCSVRHRSHEAVHARGHPVG